MIENDEAHEAAAKRMEAKRMEEAAHSPSESPKNFWAGQARKKHVLPKGVGFRSTFGPYLGKATRVETVMDFS